MVKRLTRAFKELKTDRVKYEGKFPEPTWQKTYMIISKMWAGPSTMIVVPEVFLMFCRLQAVHKAVRSDICN